MRKWIVAALLLVVSLAISQIFAGGHQAPVNVTQRTLTLYIDGKPIGNTSASQPSAITYQGTVYVPLSLVGQKLNKPVGIDPATSTVWLGERPAKPAAVPAMAPLQAEPAKTSKPAKPAAAPAPKTDAPSLYGISLGMGQQEVLTALGAPARKEPAQLGYEWWIYNRDLSRYLQIGIMDGKVVDLYSNAPTAQIEGVGIGTTYQSLSRKYSIQPIVSFSFQQADVQITNQPKDRPLVISQGTPIIFYLDKQNSANVTALRLIDRLALLRGGFFETKWTYQGTAPNFDPPRLSIKQQEYVNSAHERQILDLTNVIRYRNKLPALTALDTAANVARLHSKDMEMNQYFDHVSTITGLDPFERLKQAGVTYKMAGENIAAGFPDAIEAYESWMNSPGHRKNILEKGFRQLGVGVYLDYYTQDFVTTTDAR